ncbi:MAG: secretin N-terminal domain-containing protein [Planctomycetota bacterium]|nr:secretin N-terminal domain-containing protein [Planctomycetota bacterium]
MLFQPEGGEPAAPPPGTRDPAVPPGAPAEGTAEGDAADAGSLIGPVQIEFLEGLDVIVIRGNPRDVERVTKIIEEIERQSLETVPKIELLQLQHADGQAMAALVTTLYDQVLSPRQGRVDITPLVRPNALLLIGRDEAVQTVVDLIKRLDQPVNPETQFQVFPLKHASATEAQVTVQRVITANPNTDPNTEESNLGGTGTTPPALASRGFVIADFRTNSLIVRASPTDLREIELLISKIDVATSGTVNELRVFTLRNSLADELAPVLQNAINGQQTPGRAGGQQGQNQGQGQGPGGQQFPGQGGAQQGRQGAQQNQQQQIRSAMLQFLTVDAAGKQAYRSGILTDVRVTADAKSNAVLVSAPAESMELIAALINELDQVPTSTAQIKVFTIVNGDAQSMVQMLQTLFGLQQTGARQGGPAQVFLQQFGGGDVSGDSPLVSLRFSVDQRTNSIVASGSSGDLQVVEAILLRLDESDIRDRKSTVYRLKNSPALEVANTINQFLSSRRDLQQQTPGLVSAFEQFEREVVVVPESGSNSLIVSATPRYFDEIKRIVEQLDARPAMVMIQVLIAEVTLNNTDEFGIELGLQDSILFDRSILGDIAYQTTATTFGNPPTTVEQQTIVSATNTPGFNFNNSQPLGNSGSSSALDRASVIGGQGLSNFAVGRINNELGFGGLVLSASSESLSFLLRALSESRRVDVLSRPQVMTMDNQPAYIQVGQSVPFIQSTSYTNFGQQNNISYEEVGLILNVIPRISPDGLVVMELDAERSDVGPEAEGIPISINNNGQVIRSPRINRTFAHTTISALNGQTVVLGGLITKQHAETHRRVPILADIPILGHLFRYDNVQNRRTELLIMMTPRIVRNERDADCIKQVESSRMSWCLADVIRMNGDLGLRGRSGEWTDAETNVIYPDVDPSMIEQIVPGSEEVTTPPPAGEDILPTPGVPSVVVPVDPNTGRLPPPSSAPPEQLRIPFNIPAQQPGGVPGPTSAPPLGPTNITPIESNPFRPEGEPSSLNQLRLHESPASGKPTLAPVPTAEHAGFNPQAGNAIQHAGYQSQAPGNLIQVPPGGVQPALYQQQPPYQHQYAPVQQHPQQQFTQPPQQPVNAPTGPPGYFRQ